MCGMVCVVCDVWGMGVIYRVICGMYVVYVVYVVWYAVWCGMWVCVYGM